MTASTSRRSSPSTSLPIALAAAALLGAAAAGAQVPSFTGVGDLPGGAVDSVALGISADGTTVVGQSESASGPEAFRWTRGGGISGLGFLSGSNPDSTARAVSADGSVIVGTSRDGSNIDHAYRWSSGVMTALNTQSCDSCDPVTDAYSVSADGLTVVGSSLARGSGSSDPIHLDPVRWSGGGTSLSDLGDLAGPEEVGEAYGASSNGGLIVGSHFSNNGKDAFYWNGSGLVALPSITGGSILADTAFGVSSDGSTIVGTSNKSTVVLPGGTEVASEPQAVRWVGSGYTTLVQLGDFPGAVTTDSTALATTQDGSLIVGRAKDVDLSDRAFLWDAAHGMRDLKTVLVQDYGLDLTGWVLEEATGISDVATNGDVTIVGRGIDPQGNPEGWVAFLSTPACSDGVDNDGDTLTDWPADPQCLSPVDWSEQDDCSDGIDNDGDGQIDFPADGGCQSAADPTEQPDCSDGIDNDGDGQTDWPADLGCASAASLVEDPACQNGLDDDSDLATDYPADTGCLAPSDLSETPDCSDGLDNDGDGKIDYPADPECESALDPSEAGQCADGIDNDGDGRIDYPAEYPGCVDASDPIEAPQCSDGVDNDGDGKIDYPADTDCSGPSGVNESPVPLTQGDLIAVDRASRAVFRVDRTTGAQTLISEKALLLAPQGIAQRGGELVVADPAGLVTVQGSGVQRLASPPLVPNESLQVVFDAALDAYVLEASGLSKVVWNPSGIGAKSTWLAVPTGEPLPVLAQWHGDSLTVEQGGSFLAGGLGFVYGDGVYRITPSKVVTGLKSGIENVRWLDLAIDSDGTTILAAGNKYDVATGVYRMDPATGDSTALNNTFGWQMPTGIAVDGNDVYVADAGVCADGQCTGGQIVHVDGQTGVATPLSSGGFIAGELDLVVLPEPGVFSMWTAGVVALALLARRRTSRARR